MVDYVQHSYNFLSRTISRKLKYISVGRFSSSGPFHFFRIWCRLPMAASSSEDLRLRRNSSDNIMNPISRKIRGLGLCSGGLDSNLSALVLRKQGIEVEWVVFETPFFSSAKALKAGRINNIPVTVRKITPIYLEMLKNPPCGYGKYMNPCLDCHTLMFRLAGELMKERGFDFLFSGEVLGQRPMSQTRSSLRYVEKHSGHDGYILRPLSAKRLPETLPEKAGIVSREELLDFTGRSRKPQIRLAEAFGLTAYPAPAGGCLLTDKGYSLRLRELFDQGDHCTERALHLLKYGRHLRLADGTKIIVGRSEPDNEHILEYHDPDTDVLIHSNDIPGPTVLLPGGGDRDSILFAAAVCLGYGKTPKGKKATVAVASPNCIEDLEVMGIPPADARHLLV